MDEWTRPSWARSSTGRSLHEQLFQLLGEALRPLRLGGQVRRRGRGRGGLTTGDRRRGHIDVVRNGSRGMLWLEPLVEVVTPYGRVGYGPVTPADVAGLLAAGMLDGAD